MIKMLASLCIAAVLAACSTSGSTSGSTPAVAKTAPQTVYQLEGNYRAALKIAIAYKELIPCAAAVTVICSKPEIVKKLQAADDVAYPLLNSAELAVREGSTGTKLETAVKAATAAVEALLAITTQLKTQ